MKKLLFLGLILFSLSLADSASAWVYPSEAWAGCSRGRPTASMEWGAVTGANSYRVWRGATKVYEGRMTAFTDTGLDYRTTYRYEIEAIFPPEVQWRRVDGGDVTTGSCAYVSSFTGPTTANVGETKSYSASFVADSYYGHTYDHVLLCPPNQSCVYYTGTSPDAGVTNVTLPFNVTFSQTGNYLLIARARVPNPSPDDPVMDEKTLTVRVTVPPSDRDLKIDESDTSVTINVGEKPTAKWKATGVESCRAYTSPSNVTDWTRNPLDFGESYRSREVNGFNEPTLGNPITLFLDCPGREITFDDKSDLATGKSLLAHFLGFIKTVYAIESNPDSVNVYVNALPEAVLNVESTGASRASITGSPSSFSGTTDYTRTSDISQTVKLSADADGPNGASFTGWSGCNSRSDRSGGIYYGCIVNLVPGNPPKTVTASFSKPGYPDLIVNSISITPADPDYGSTVYFSAVVKNAGTKAAGASSLAQLRIDWDSNGGGSIWDTVVAPSQSVGNLAAGATETETWSPLARRPGTHVAQVCVDINDSVDESGNEDNNCSVSAPFTFPEHPTTLRVESTPARDVPFTSTNGYSGRTDKIFESDEEIEDAIITAPETVDNWSGEWIFSSWSSCDRVVGRRCTVSVDKNDSKTVTMNYISEQQNWDYVLENSDPVSIDKKGTGVGQKVITRRVTSGTPDAASTISLSGVPEGVTASIANNPCTPSCGSTITFTVDGSAPNGANPITVTSQPGAKTLNFNLIITGHDMSVICVPEPATALIGQPVTWTANVSGGKAPYAYVWSGSGIPTNPAPTANPYTVTYSTIGRKNITATVTDANDNTASCSEDSSVFINFDPQFEEF